MENPTMKEFEAIIAQQKSEINLLRSVIDNLPASVYWKNLEGVYLGRNRYAAEKMVSVGLASDLDDDVMVGKTDYSLFTKEAADKYRENDLYVIETGNESVYEEAVKLPNGETILQLSNKKPLRDENGNIIGVIGNTVEITELKEAQERERLALAKVAEEEIRTQSEIELRQAVMILAGSIAHDLRTPIAIIAMDGQSLEKVLPKLVDVCKNPIFEELLDEQKITPSKLESIKTTPDGIIKTAYKMQKFIDVTLKTLSKALARKFSQEDLVRCSMWHCIHNTLTSFPFLEGQRELVHNEMNNFDFMGNEVLMVRIFSNLLNNSLQQIEKNKSGKIFISTESSAEENILKFKDTAGGAAPEIVAHLFDGYKTTKEGGTGIGLSFCKLAMENFGGTIACNSVPGDYIEFSLSFPKIKTET